MDAIRTFARVCSLLLATSLIGCSSDEPEDMAGAGGSGAVLAGGSSAMGGAAVGGTEAGGGGIGGLSASGGTSGNAAAGAAGLAGVVSISSAGSAGTPAAAGASNLSGEAGRSSSHAGASGSGNTIAGAAGATQVHTIGGVVSGLKGTGLRLSLGSSSIVTVAADGAFSFPTPVAAGSTVKVAVATQPSTPAQTCVVSAAGTISAVAHDVTDIAVTCTTNSYAIGGNVIGLIGSGLVLRNDRGDELQMGGNGRFAFPTKYPSGQAFTVTVPSQPTAPSQNCLVSGGSGTVGGADVSSVSINCSTNTFTIGGTVAGLSGNGLVLTNNGAEDVALSANGSFAFPSPTPSGGAFAVTVKTQPNAPVQTCSVVSGTGTVANGHVNSIQVNCTTNRYSVQGTVTGLSGTGLTLQNNLSDSLAVTGDGVFTFPSKVPSGENFSVTVQAQPSGPAQVCTVSNGSGTIAGSDVSSVNVNCITKKYTLGGSVVGLEGAGLVLRNNGGDDLSIADDGSFVFANAIPSGQGFDVTIASQPVGQRCSLVGGRGTIGSSDVTSVTVNCSEATYLVGGTISGLSGSGLELSLNGNTPVSFTANASFAFPSLLATNRTYAVSIAQQPSTPWQTCTLTNANGTIGTADVTDVIVTCTTNAYGIGGTVSGLAGSGLVLRDQDGDDLTITDDGAFSFPGDVASGMPYAVTVATQPSSPAQTCTVTNGGGTVGGAEITNVRVICVTNAYAIGGTISGLVGSVVLANNGTDTLTRTANGGFTFGNAVSSGGRYDVTVTAHPTTPLQDCSVTNGVGTVQDQDVTNVNVVCVTRRFAIGGTVTGLSSGQQLVLQNNAGDDLTVAADGSFRFATAIASGATYAVAVLNGPVGQVCTVSGGTGTVGSADVTSVTVNCTNLRTVGGTVTGLSGSGLVLRSGTENLPVSGNGTFAFNTLYAEGSTYAVTVQAQPTSPWQTCVVTNGSGLVAGNVTDVTVTCTSNPYSVAVNVTGLVGSGLLLQNNNADNLPIPANGRFDFASQVLSGHTYNVTVLTQPSSPVQTCTVAAATGTMTDANVTLAVSCVTNSFTIGGTVAGYVGNGLVLRNNGASDLSITRTGVFTFPGQVANGNNYAVTIATQPSGLICSVSHGTGTVSNANVTSIRVNCAGYGFDSGVQGWSISNPPAGISQPTWSSTQGNPGLGSLLVSLPFTTSNCQQIDLNVPPPTALNATGTTLTVWVRFDGFPNSPPAGTLQLYAQDSSWAWNASQYQLSSFQSGVWRQLSLTLPTTGNWTKVNAWGLQMTPGGSSTCQAATVYIDSFQLQ